MVIEYVRDKKRNGKRTFRDIRTAILICLSSGKHTINQVSYHTRINWKTVELHLTYLAGRGFVDKVLDSEYAKIFELSELGKEYVRSLGISIMEKKKRTGELKL